MQRELDGEMQAGSSTGTRTQGAPNVLKPSGSILVVEDDLPLGRFLLRMLRSAHYEAELASDGGAALVLLHGSRGTRTTGIDLVILDVNLPEMNDFDVLRELRPEQPRLPVLVLTARRRIEDTVRALECGADDCLIKPFSYVEMLARVAALLRRNTEVIAPISQVGDLTLHHEKHLVQRGTHQVELTPREFGLLQYLMRTPGIPVSRAVLMEEVWGVQFDPSTNVVDVYMKYLRDKIDRDGEPKLIRTVRGVGYVITAT